MLLLGQSTTSLARASPLKLCRAPVALRKPYMAENPDIMPPLFDPDDDQPRVFKEKPAASTTDDTTAAGLLVSLSALGIDAINLNAIESAELAALLVVVVATAADNDGPLGKALRGVGSVTNEAVKQLGGLAKWSEENEVALKSRAVAELAIEQAIMAARTGTAADLPAT